MGGGARPPTMPSSVLGLPNVSLLEVQGDGSDSNEGETKITGCFQTEETAVGPRDV